MADRVNGGKGSSLRCPLTTIASRRTRIKPIMCFFLNRLKSSSSFNFSDLRWKRAKLESTSCCSLLKPAMLL
ncbi:Uncharacterised protein [Vibrio cholerae]|nr:Uncharacterised protein [Vibrio cholerae]